MKMPDLLSTILVLVLLMNFFVLGTSRLRAVVQASAAQGALLGGLVLLAHPHPGLEAWLLAVGAALVKGVVIPRLLLRAMREAAIRREVEPYVGFVPSMLLGALATGLSLVFAQTLPLAPEHQDSLLVPTALATVLSGFLVLTTRRKAITQVVGYLLLENGIFVMGTTLVRAMPFLVEVGVLLDLFVAIFTMGIIINHIQREISSLDTARLAALKE